MESEATCGEEGALIFARYGESGDKAEVRVGFHDADELGPGDGFDGAGGERLGADAVGGALIQSGKAENIARAGDAQEEEATIAGRGGDFDAAAADDVDMIGG